MRRKLNHKTKNKEHNNHTLDGFMKGLTNAHAQNATLTPKIRVPASSGYQPLFKPVQSPFIYPQIGQFRQYQYQIALQCVTHNTLVCLPTGLGKTYIASVLICNYYKWFPQGKIFFLAPTKPLVDQQTYSLRQFSQLIDLQDIKCLTGGCIAKKRTFLYEKKRIFFCTPQTLQNDLEENRLDKKSIVLLIIDEAHKATGNYAYSNIVRILQKQSFGYRIVGLSATPGNNKQKVQQVIHNLLITKMVVKSESDPNVAKYLRNKAITEVFIQESTIIREICGAIDKMALKEFNILVSMGLCSKFRLNPRNGIDRGACYIIRQQIAMKSHELDYNTKGSVLMVLRNLHFLGHGKEILKNSGYQSFINAMIHPLEKIQKIQETSQTNNSLGKNSLKGQEGQVPQLSKKFKEKILNNEEFTKFRKMLTSPHFSSNLFNHPKLLKLSEILIEFFNSKQAIAKKSKVIIFAQFRNTCYEIKKAIEKVDCVKAEMFFGQSKTTVQYQSEEETISASLQMTQKQQKKLIEKFRNNQINTLISTSIGEQGLDIGEVDCIVCYDGGNNIVRSIQRMGRTGRKRDGKVYVLLMQGKQTSNYVNTGKKSKQMANILKDIHNFTFYGFNSTMFEQGTEIPINRIKYDQQQLEQKKCSKESSVIYQDSKQKIQKFKAQASLSENSYQEQSLRENKSIAEQMKNGQQIDLQMLGDYDLGFDFSCGDFSENLNDTSFFSENSEKSDQAVKQFQNMGESNTHQSSNASLSKKSKYSRHSLPKIEEIQYNRSAEKENAVIKEQNDRKNVYSLEKNCIKRQQARELIKKYARLTKSQEEQQSSEVESVDSSEMMQKMPEQRQNEEIEVHNDSIENKQYEATKVESNELKLAQQVENNRQQDESSDSDSQESILRQINQIMQNRKNSH